MLQGKWVFPKSARQMMLAQLQSLLKPDMNRNGDVEPNGKPPLRGLNDSWFRR